MTATFSPPPGRSLCSSPSSVYTLRVHGAPLHLHKADASFRKTLKCGDCQPGSQELGDSKGRGLRGPGPASPAGSSRDGAGRRELWGGGWSPWVGWGEAGPRAVTAPAGTAPLGGGQPHFSLNSAHEGRRHSTSVSQRALCPCVLGGAVPTLRSEPRGTSYLGARALPLNRTAPP